MSLARPICANTCEISIMVENRAAEGRRLHNTTHSVLLIVSDANLQILDPRCAVDTLAAEAAGTKALQVAATNRARSCADAAVNDVLCGSRCRAGKGEPGLTRNTRRGGRVGRLLERQASSSRLGHEKWISILVGGRAASRRVRAGFGSGLNLGIAGVKRQRSGRGRAGARRLADRRWRGRAGCGKKGRRHIKELEEVRTSNSISARRLTFHRGALSQTSGRASNKIVKLDGRLKYKLVVSKRRLSPVFYLSRAKAVRRGLCSWTSINRGLVG